MNKIKHILCTLLSLTLTACLCAAPVSAADAAGQQWQEAYRTVISKNTDKYGSVCQLADFNLDGTPELIIGGIPGTGLFSVIQHAFTYRDGAAAEISVPDEYLKLADSYELYRNDSTGAVRVEGKYVLRAGRGSVANVTADYVFDGSSFSYKSTFVASEDMGQKTYTVGDKAVSAGQYDSAFNSRNDGWTKLDFPVSVLTAAGKPTSSEIDGLFNGYNAGPVLAVPSVHGMQVNGTAVSIAAYNIGGSNYFKLRDLAMLLTDTSGRFEVGFDSAANRITLTTGQSYTAAGAELSAGDTSSHIASPMASSVFIDGRSVSLTGYNINGSNYFKLRDLGDALGFDVGWDESTRTAGISTAR